MSKKQLAPASKYDVGFGKPPRETQFVKGQSGNPQGRPKGAKNKNPGNQLEKIIMSEAYRTIKVNDESGLVTMPIVQAVARSISIKAAKGDHRSQKLMLDMTRAIEKNDAIRKDTMSAAAITYIKEADYELHRRKLLGVTGPDILPHPDDIFVDPTTGEFTINGPVTFREKEHFEGQYKTKENLQTKLDEVEERLEEDVDDEERADLEELIPTLRQIIQVFEDQLLGWRPKET
ncbi:MAG: hypothetical protein HON14_03070 [Rhodospirillaceae bacterium]|jgi:hypothetical protein|nr:hypothetical protein [Rhodospirillaceae bacterium]MBT5939424.1 hypothetical protein [Rhodospirillaceae bacterium]MBT7266643.1 hypothetical protein [Rhodospirillaceae bacterium]